MSLLKIEELRVYFRSGDRTVKANNSIDLEVINNEILGIIGETGCGKSILGRAIMTLLSDNTEVSGKIIYKDENLLTLPENKLRDIRGKNISIILQNPAAALNPVFSIGDQISEVFRYHDKMSKQDAKIKTAGILEMVGIDPERMSEFPHQFSGGMKQRIMIAMGMAFSPELLIADEPTKGLDPDTKDKIVTLLRDLVRSMNMSMILITHDLDVAEKMCDRIAVMYAGEIIELASVQDILAEPGHPYTQVLLSSLPKKGLRSIPGESPSLSSPPSGCRFHPRCEYAMDICKQNHPDMFLTDTGTEIRCFLYNGGLEQP
jgi:oligopeptide/dipeptide ABC transporter ATP-binding protein